MGLQVHFRVFWFAALALVAVAQVAHAFEHWEVVAHADCVAHTHEDDNHGDGGSHHDHGCASHDHAPALMGSVFILTITETVSAAASDCLGAPAPRASSIDHPPQLS
ncbi:MAG: hypothetical protein WCQ57_11915 [Verrucomicrobiota bacterium]